MDKYKHIRADIYRRGITIFVGPRKNLLRFVKDYINEKPLTLKVEESGNSTSYGTTFGMEDGQSLIWIPKFPKTPEEVAILGHEILHATFILLDYCGVEYRYEGANEPYTYLFEHFLMEALDKKGYENVEKD